jgi:hypothetical protein
MIGSKILNEELIKVITDGIEEGLPIKAVVGRARIGKTIYYRWIKQGEEDIENGVDSMFSYLVDEVYLAEAKLMQKWITQTAGEPQGTRWLLSRRFRENFGDKLELEHSGTVDVEITWPDEVEE